MKLTASKLRENIYRILDQVLKTGKPVVIKRKGRILKIVSQEGLSKTSRLMRRDIIRVPAQELVHIDWSEEWKPD